MNSKAKIPVLASILVTLNLFQTSSLHSQSTVSTPIVGFQKVDVGVGLNAVGFPLLNNDLLKVSATSLTSNALSLSGQSNVGALLTAGEPYYIEVYSGTLKGDRFDVDTAATKSSSDGSVVLSSSSSNNTYPVSSISGQLDGQTIALRKHITLEQIQGMSQTPMTGSNTAANADQIQLFSGTTFTTYFLRADGLTWRGSTTGTTSQNKVPVPPGTGVFIKKATASGSLVSTGTVRANDFALPLNSGLQLLAPAFPLNYSPASLGGTTANGWTGSNTSANADQIQVFNNSGGTGTFTTYFLRADGSTWRGSTTGTADQKNTLIVSDSAGFFVKRSASDANNVLVNPIAP